MINLILNLIGSQIIEAKAGPPGPPAFTCTIASGDEFQLITDLITDCDPILIES